MLKLISKVQYKNFEIGEFVHEKERSYETTIELIEQFPWSNQRDKIVIGLTNPSITIEGTNNNFLKLTFFYNRKYVLYYFNANQALYSKSVATLEEAYKFIKNYFDEPIFDTTEFRKEISWFQYNLKHFVTKDFKYSLTARSIGSYLLSTSGINFCVSIVFIILIISNRLASTDAIGYIFILVTMFLMGGGLHLVLFFNYYNYTKGKVLVMSKGNDTFYFGNINNPHQFDKKDILQYTTIRSHGSRNQFRGFAIVEIEFKNGMVLKIPNLLVDHTAMEHKLFEYSKIDENKFPFLRP